MHVKEPVLIIAFKFPPLGGMRVKRMTMFAKYLAKKGYQVHVVTVHWNVQDVNTWMEDTQHPNIFIHRIVSLSPHHLLYEDAKGWWRQTMKKIAYRLKRLLYFVDEAQYWGISLLPFAKRLIKEKGITNVICTGAPFMANYWAARLKQAVPDIHLMQDFRDPWNDHLCASYHQYFRFGWQKRRSQEYERYALTHADTIIAVTDSLKTLLKNKVENHARWVTLSNGFDPERYEYLQFQPNRNKMKLVYIGNLFVGRDRVFRDFLKSVQQLMQECPEFKVSFELVTYGGLSPSIAQEFQPLIDEGIFKPNGYVSPEVALREAGNAFALLLINADFFPFLVSGKVYEYIALNRPIYAVTPDGELPKLIQKGHLGQTVPTDNPEAQKKGLLNLFELWKQNPAYVPKVDPKFVQQFRYDQLVDQLTTLFKTSP